MEEESAKEKLVSLKIIKFMKTHLKLVYKKDEN